MLPFLLHVLLPSLSYAIPQVTFGLTTINGVQYFNEDFFGGIPFAQPPTGGNRFNPPILLSSLPSGSFDATKYGASCLQASVNRFTDP
jgi:acetylcholinesterase